MTEVYCTECDFTTDSDPAEPSDLKEGDECPECGGELYED